MRPQNQLLNAAVGASALDNSFSCPTWYTRMLQNGDIWCVCKDTTVQGGSVIRCPKKDRICLTCEGREVLGRDDLNVSILTAFCMTHNFSTQQTLLAACPYNYHSFNSSDMFVTMPSMLSELNEFMCKDWQRQGDLCNRCVNNTGPSIFGRSGSCSNVEDNALYWLGFLSLEFVPPSLIFFLILCCKVRATTGPLNAFIFFCQMFYTVTLLQTNALSNVFDVKSSYQWDSVTDAIKCILLVSVGSFYTFWDNQYVFITKYFLLMNISSLQVRALQYMQAVYPLFLVVLSYTIVRLHYNGCRVLVYMWRPFKHCKSKLGINWQPMTSIIHTFATFILLVYTKIIEVSFILIAPSRIYNQTGELPYKIMSYDASVHFLSRQHLPYVILALSMLTIFCGLPLLVLFLYPMACFQRLLSQTTSPHIRQMLRIFTEAYTGCYKDKTMPHQSLDCRYFASLYFLFRVVYLACLFFVEYSYVWLSLILIPLFISSLFAIIQPYKSKWLNVIDFTTFALGGLVTLLYTYDIHIAEIPLWIPNSFSALPLVFFITFVLYKIFYKIRSRCVKHQAENVEAQNGGNGEESTFRQGRRATEISPLINPTHACMT